MVATRSARFSRCVLRCQGSRSPSTALMLRAACSIPPIQTPNPSKNGPSSSRYPTVNHFRPKPIGGEGWPFAVNGIGFSKGEPVEDADVVVFWYVAHLFHHSREGGDAWHGAGPTIRAVVPTPPPLPLHFSIDVRKRRDQFGGEVTVTGTGFSPEGQVKLSYLNIPRRVGALYTGAIITADGNGKFTNTDYFRCVSRNPDDAFLDVEVDALD